LALKDPAEYRAFAGAMADRMQILSEITSHYIGKLDKEQSDYFIETALEKMWECRKSVRSPTLIRKHWRYACTFAAKSRETWTVHTITGDKIVPGAELYLWGVGRNGDVLDTI
jgi:hypothetical protein